MNAFVCVVFLAGLALFSGCATPAWARNDDWIKREHWQIDPNFNPAEWENSDDWARDHRHWYDGIFNKK